MAPSAVTGSAPPNQAIIRAGSRPEVDSAFSAAASRRALRGQPDRSRRAASSSKKLSASALLSTSCHWAIFLATGSCRLSMAMRAPDTSPRLAAARAVCRLAESVSLSAVVTAVGGVVIRLGAVCAEA